MHVVQQGKFGEITLASIVMYLVGCNAFFATVFAVVELYLTIFVGARTTDENHVHNNCELYVHTCDEHAVGHRRRKGSFRSQIQCTSDYEYREGTDEVPNAAATAAATTVARPDETSAAHTGTQTCGDVGVADMQACAGQHIRRRRQHET